MQRPLATRKRNAPGSSLTPPQTQQQFNNGVTFQPLQDPPTSFDASFIPWDGANNITSQYSDQPGYDGNIYDTGMNGSLGLDNGAGVPSAPVSSQLVRRNPNQQLATRGQTSWQDTGAPQTGEVGWPQVEEDTELEQRAAAAKKDAQTRRKQIPPFVQKLSR